MAKRSKPKSLRDDPEVQSMTALLNAGRAAERMDIVEELEGLLRGTRGWWKPGNAPESAEAREVLEDFKRWVERRG